MWGNWLVYLDADDREKFWDECAEAMAAARVAGDVRPVEVLLRDWRITAQALSDPQRREVLTAAEFSSGAFLEVGPPGE